MKRLETATSIRKNLGSEKMELKKQSKILWLFPDMVGLVGVRMQIRAIDETDSRNGKKIPIMLLSGNIQGRQMEVLVATWNVENWNTLLDMWSTDSGAWCGKDVRVRTSPTDMKKVIVEPWEEAVK